MTALAATTARKRRERRERNERLYREWICGGPLVDHAMPVVGGPNDAAHLALVKAELELRARNMNRETRLLAADFADRCCLVRAERIRMWLLLVKLLRAIGPPKVVPTHSTTPATRTMTGTTIPRL